MHHNAGKSVLGTDVRTAGVQITVYYFSLQFCQTRDSVGLHVQVPRKLKVVVEFDGTHPLVVILEPLKLYPQHLGQLSNTEPFHRNHLFRTLLAVISISTF